MAFTLVQKSAAVANNSAGSVTATLPAGSTAGNLLVACLGSNVPGTQFTGPSGWVQGPQTGNGSLSRAEIWYYPSCPGGITSAVFTCATGQVRAALAEFHSSVAGDTFTLETSGTGTASATTTCTATTAGSATAGDLNVAAFFEHLPAAAAPTWTDPASYTLLASNTASNQNPMYSAYKLSATGGTVNVTGTSNQTAGTNGWSGAVASFKETAPSGLTVTTTSLPAGSVGVAYNAGLAATGGTPPYTWSISAGSLPAGLSLASSGGRGGLFGLTVFMKGTNPSVSTANWETVTGINTAARKCYFQTNPDGSGIFPTTPDSQIQACIDNGLVLYLCVKPALNPPTTHDYNGLQASVTAMQNLGLTVKVILWQEVELQVSSAALYKAALAFYAGAVHTPGATLCHDASASAGPSKWPNYFPDTASGSLAVVDEYGIDFYANTYAHGTRIDPYVSLAGTTGKPFGVMEIGTSIGNASPPSQSVVTDYLNYVNGFAGSLPPGLYAWYQSENTNVNNLITDPSDFRIPLLQKIANTISGTGTGAGTITGTPTAAGTSSFTVKATDTNAATGTAALSITIGSSAGSPVVTTTSLPAATVGVAYTLTALTETGGTGPFTWAVTDGALPDGLTMGPLGFIFGTPAADAATSGFTVTVTDANQLTGSAALFITVVAGAPPPDPAPNALGFPQVIIEAGLNAAAPQVPAGTFILDDPVYGQLSEGNMLGDSTAWTDIAGLFIRGSISRPSTRVQGPLLTYQGGTATGTFDNTTGVLDPDNPSSTYYGALRPMVPFQIRAVYGSVSYPMWAGFTSSIAGADLTYDMGYDEVTITADDGFKILNGITIPASPGSSGTTGGPGTGDGDGEDSGARITRILNAAAWYTDHRRVSTGDSPLQGTLWGDTALNLLQLTADSEIGELYMDGAGNVTFRNRHAIITDTRSTTVQAVFGDLPGTSHPAGTELACIPHRRATDDTTLANDIQATSVGLDLQEAQSLTSQRKYLFPRTYARTDLILDDDPTTLEWAQWVLAVSLDGDDRFDSITIDPLADPANLYPQVLAREIGDRIQVWRRPQNSGAVISQDCFIRGIQHDVDAAAGTWSTTWTLQSALRYTGFLILDDPVNGLLDTGKLAF